MIGIIDYGLGNIQAFCNIYRRLNIPFLVVRTCDQLCFVDRIILPGVGAFDWAMSRLNNSGLREKLDQMVKKEHYPVLGICVGMQIMANRSEEGEMSGLGWVEGEVLRFCTTNCNENLYLPHMGWNDVNLKRKDPLFEGLESEARFYFLHSFYFHSLSERNILTSTVYHTEFASAVRSRNVAGVQFHPEKSHAYGTRLLENFARS